jgi:hypothetical protein
MFSNQIAKEWKYKWFGFWGSEEKHLGKVYLAKDYIDTSCSEENRRKISNYLQYSPIILAGQQSKQKCGLCDELAETPYYRSDGIWLWADSLGHYVECHNFCIPNAMAEHILSLNGTPPQDVNIEIEDLPWP